MNAPSNDVIRLFCANVTGIESNCNYEAVTVKYFRHVNTPFKVKSHRSNKRA